MKSYSTSDKPLFSLFGGCYVFGSASFRRSSPRSTAIAETCLILPIPCLILRQDQETTNLMNSGGTNFLVFRKLFGRKTPIHIQDYRVDSVNTPSTLCGWTTQQLHRKPSRAPFWPATRRGLASLEKQSFGKFLRPIDQLRKSISTFIPLDCCVRGVRGKIQLRLPLEGILEDTFHQRLLLELIKHGVVGVKSTMPPDWIVAAKTGLKLNVKVFTKIFSISYSKEV